MDFPRSPVSLGLGLSIERSIGNSIVHQIGDWRSKNTHEKFSLIMEPYVQVVPTHMLGESPHWNAAKQELLYVDILAKDVHRYVPSTGEHTRVHIEEGEVDFGKHPSINDESGSPIKMLKHVVHLSHPM